MVENEIGKCIVDAHQKQLLTYLRLTGMHLVYCLIQIGFGEYAQVALRYNSRI